MAGHETSQPGPSANSSSASLQMQQIQMQQQQIQQQQMQLSVFWQNVMTDIQKVDPAKEDFKNHQLPLARIKKIMKFDEDVKMISAEAPVLFAKACEIFILESTLRSWIHTEENKRRTLQRNDIAMAITKTDVFDFLIDIVPRDDIKPTKKLSPEQAAFYYLQQPMAQVQGSASHAPSMGSIMLDPQLMYQQQQHQQPMVPQFMQQPNLQLAQLPQWQQQQHPVVYQQQQTSQHSSGQAPNHAASIITSQMGSGDATSQHQISLPLLQSTQMNQGRATVDV